MQNHFRVLGVKLNASDDEIKKAYRRLANQFHPDKLINSSDEEKAFAAIRLQQIQEAYTCLTDQASREEFIKGFNNRVVTSPIETAKEIWEEYYP